MKGVVELKLWTEELAEITPVLYTNEETPLEQMLVTAKFFALGTSWSWYVMEAERQPDDDVVFFGYVDTGDWCSELGYFTLNQLKEPRLYFGELGSIPAIERDLHFTSKPFGKIKTSGRGDAEVETDEKDPPFAPESLTDTDEPTR